MAAFKPNFHRIFTEAQAYHIMECVMRSPLTQTRQGYTFCNWGLSTLLDMLYSFPSFAKINANTICDRLATTEQWEEIPEKECTHTSTLGRLLLENKALVVAAYKNPNPGKSGHVALCTWHSWVNSDKWGRKVPICANIGKTNGFMGVNFAFAEFPKFYVGGNIVTGKEE